MILAVFQKTIADQNGDIVNGASVEVRLESDNSLATIYSDAAGTTAENNPLTTGADGLAMFYADTGLYKITATYGADSSEMRNVHLISPAAFITETTGTAASGTISRADGGIQTYTMTADTTFGFDLVDGQSLTLHLSGGDVYVATWPAGIKWMGDAAPTLTANDVLEFWVVGSTLYGAFAGSYT